MSELLSGGAPQRVLDSWNTLVHRGDNKFVSVNNEALDTLAGENPDIEVPDWRFPGQHPENDWAFASQTIVSSVLNYMFLEKEKPGAGWEMNDPDKPGQVLVSSNALHTRVNQVFGEAEDISWRDISKLSDRHVFEEFLPGIPLAESRRRLLGHFAYGLFYNYDGSVRNLLESTVDSNGEMRAFYGDDAGLVNQLLHPDFGEAFEDYAAIDDLRFPFLKRAQLAPLLIYGRARTSDVLPRVGDVEHIGPVVDYQLPRALRHMGVLTYMPELAHAVDTWQPIPAMSQQEIEIRAATAYSADYLLTKTNEIRADLGQSALNMAHIDFWLWTKGRALKKMENPPYPHFTETTAY